MKVLVAMSGGVDSSVAAARLIAAGHEVVGVDNLSMGLIGNLAEFQGDPRFRFVQGDVTDPAVLAGLGSGFEAIVHLAAFKIPRYGKAIDTLKINYRGTENALELARRLGCKLVLASTSDVYGRNPNLPFSEDGSDCVIGSSKSPRWAYAVSKLFDEHLALAYQDAYGFPVTALRFFGSYGPKQPLSWWGGPPPVFIDCVLSGKPVPVHGDGSQTRSFTYVTDTVEGIYQATVRPEANGEIINIGSIQETTILDLARRIKRLSGTPGELKVEFVPYASFTGRKYEDVMRRVPDVALCERLLGVRAKVDIDDGHARTIEWQRGAARRAAG
ncbi:MAG: NAD-dependent epimerase/dehydratase family protein [Geminicoccales bacterium]